MGEGRKSLTHSRTKRRLQKQRKRCLRTLRDHFHVEEVITSGRPTTPEVVKHISEEDRNLPCLPTNDMIRDLSTTAVGGSSPVNTSPGPVADGAQSTEFYYDDV